MPNGKALNRGNSERAPASRICGEHRAESRMRPSSCHPSTTYSAKAFQHRILRTHVRCSVSYPGLRDAPLIRAAQFDPLYIRPFCSKELSVGARVRFLRPSMPLSENHFFTSGCPAITLQAYITGTPQCFLRSKNPRRSGLTGVQ